MSFLTVLARLFAYRYASQIATHTVYTNVIIIIIPGIQFGPGFNHYAISLMIINKISIVYFSLGSKTTHFRNKNQDQRNK